MDQVIDRYNATSADGPHEAIKDSLARMGAAYIDDLNYSTYNFGGSGDAWGVARSSEPPATDANTGTSVRRPPGTS